VLIFVDIEKSFNKLTLLLVPYLGRIVHIWYDDSDESLAAFDLSVLNGYYEVFADILSYWAIFERIILVS
jgi:hypothetical protein